jgi:hypothetical protein
MVKKQMGAGFSQGFRSRVRYGIQLFWPLPSHPLHLRPRHQVTARIHWQANSRGGQLKRSRVAVSYGIPGKLAIELF